MIVAICVSSEAVDCRVLNQQQSAPDLAPVGSSVTVAVSTLGARLAGVTLPPPHRGIRYLILVQKGEGAVGSAEITERSDVTRRDLQGVGLSLSRNAALDHASGALLVFADDDMTLSVEGIMALARVFEEDPALDFAAGWRSDRLPRAGRRGRVHRLHHFNSGRIAAPELMVRRSAVIAAGIRFDPDFGLGAKHGLGEEYVFVTDALKAGLQGRSFAVVIGAHPHESTGDDWRARGLMNARIAVLTRVFGRSAALVRLVYAVRYRRRIGRWSSLWRFVRGDWI